MCKVRGGVGGGKDGEFDLRRKHARQEADQGLEEGLFEAQPTLVAARGREDVGGCALAMWDAPATRGAPNGQVAMASSV